MCLCRRRIRRRRRVLRVCVGASNRFVRRWWRAAQQRQRHYNHRQHHHQHHHHHLRCVIKSRTVRPAISIDSARGAGVVSGPSNTFGRLNVPTLLYLLVAQQVDRNNNCTIASSLHCLCVKRGARTHETANSITHTHHTHSLTRCTRMLIVCARSGAAFFFE